MSFLFTRCIKGVEGLGPLFLPSMAAASRLRHTKSLQRNALSLSKHFGFWALNLTSASRELQPDRLNMRSSFSGQSIKLIADCTTESGLRNVCSNPLLYTRAPTHSCSVLRTLYESSDAAASCSSRSCFRLFYNKSGKSSYHSLPRNL